MLNTNHFSTKACFYKSWLLFIMLAGLASCSRHIAIQHRFETVEVLPLPKHPSTDTTKVIDNKETASINIPNHIDNQDSKVNSSAHSTRALKEKISRALPAVSKPIQQSGHKVSATVDKLNPVHFYNNHMSRAKRTGTITKGEFCTNFILLCLIVGIYIIVFSFCWRFLQMSNIVLGAILFVLFIVIVTFIMLYFVGLVLK